MTLTINERKTLTDTVKRLKKYNQKSRTFMENLENEKLCQTELYEKYWITTIANENLIELLEMTFDISE